MTLGILTDGTGSDVCLTETMAPIVEANQDVVFDAYVAAVGQQTKENDAFSGSVDVLLNVGKAIAPYVSEEKRRIQIINAWNKVIEQLPSTEEQLVVSKLEDIENAMNTFHSRVKKLRIKGWRNVDIARMLNVSRSKVARVANKLLDTEEITPQKSTPKEVAAFKAKVKELKTKGLSNRNIAKLLGVPTVRVTKAAWQLRKAEEITA